jgi:hypothetical protein
MKWGVRAAASRGGVSIAYGFELGKGVKCVK